jgi:hypothetical protein
MPYLFKLRPETPTFLETAPWVFKSEIELDISVEECFNILMDDRAWKLWHPEVTDIQWKTDPPHGRNGSVRTVVYKDWVSYLMLGGPVAMEEKFENCTDTGPTRAFTVSFTATGRPTWMFLRASKEHFQVEPIENSPGRCKFSRTVAVDPAFLPRYIFYFITYNSMKHTFTNKCPQRLLNAVQEKKLPILDQP